MTKAELAALIKTLNTGIALFVIKENRRPLIEYIADSYISDFKNHFIEACLKDNE